MNLLVTGAWHCTQEQLNDFASMGHKVVYMQDERGVLPTDASNIEGVICNGLFLYHDIRCFQKLKYIQLTSAGFDRVPMDYITEHNIRIYNARGVYSIPMAEFALCGVLQILKQSKFFTKNQENHKWEKHRNLIELYGKTVCMIGCGSVGTECAKRFSAFGCNVIGVDLYPRYDENYETIHSLEQLDDALEKSDVIVLTLPFTEKTKHLINRERFRKMKNNAIVVNIARGAVIDTAELVKMLDCGKLGGAVLDVFEEEPLDANNPIWNSENVIVTPHNSFVGESNQKRLSEVIFENLMGA